MIRLDHYGGGKAVYSGDHSVHAFVASVIDQLRPFGVKEVGVRLKAGMWPADDRGEAWEAATCNEEGELEFTVMIMGADNE